MTARVECPCGRTVQQFLCMLIGVVISLPLLCSTCAFMAVGKACLAVALQDAPSCVYVACSTYRFVRWMSESKLEMPGHADALRDWNCG